MSLLRFPRFVLSTFAGVLAVFAAMNTVIGWFSSNLDANWIWIDGAPLPSAVVSLIVVGFALSMWLYRPVARVCAVMLAGICFLDALTYWRLIGDDSIASPLSTPLSLIIAMSLLAWSLLRRFDPDERASKKSSKRRQLVIRALGVGAIVVVGIWSHIASFGETDYRRPADAAVVLGCKVRPNGDPSLALEDRTRTACRLYRSGLVSKIVLSGGHASDVPISEPECMKRIAMSEGVPEDAIILDETGATTRATMMAASALAKSRGWTSVLVVSHDYHLARIRLMAKRLGLAAFTVPAKETVRWPTKNVAIVREIVAFGWHFLRG